MTHAEAETETDDLTLLRRWAEGRSEPAFRAVVERYAGLVFGVALRRTGERPLAEEAVQNVFTDLARKAPLLLESRRPLAAWLHRCAVYEAISLLRAEIRHREKMKRFSHTPADADGPAPDPWQKLRPVLDEAINALPEADRRVLLLHWFEKLPFAEIAARTGGTPGAAQRRGSRAVDKLGALLRRRGAVLSSAMLATGLTPQLTQAAPAGLAASVSAAAVQTAPAAAGGLTVFLSKSFEIMASAKFATAAVVILAAALPVGVQWAQSAASPVAFASAKPPPLPAASGSRSSPPASGMANPAFDLNLVRLAIDGLLADPENYERQLEFRRFLFSLDLAEIPAVQALFMAVPGKRKEFLYEASHALFARWAELDPNAAAEAALSVPKSAYGFYPLRGAFITWAFADLDKAWSWLEQKTESPFDREFLGGEALAGIAADPAKFDGVMTRLESMKEKDEEWREKLRYWVLRAAPPRQGVQWALGLKDEKARALWLPKAVELAGAREPEYGLRQLGHIENTQRRAEAGHNILWPWLLARDARGHRSPPDLVDRLPEQFGVWPPTLFRDTGDALTRQDAATALATLHRLPQGPERGEFIQGMLTGTAYSDAAAILPALSLLPEQELIRNGGLSSFTQVLSRQNPRAAAEWITSLPTESPVRAWAEPHFRKIAGSGAAEYLAKSPK
ncbi:MAG: sigma-70 family RNA polymerase sigma factor [Verrucomicrobiota bacterium]